MKRAENLNAPSMGGWFIAAAMGLLAAAVAFIVGDFRPIIAIFIGVIIFLLAGLILGMPWGAGAAGPLGASGASDTDKPQDGQSVGEAVSPVVASPAAGLMSSNQGSAASVAQETAESAAVSTGSAESMTAPAPMAAASLMSEPVEVASSELAPSAVKKPRASAKPKVTAAMDEPKAATKAPAKAKLVTSNGAEEKPKRAKTVDGPERLKTPRKGKADDLKEIEGIGPALEKLCNELGFYHFDQIANWSDADVAWVDQNMKTFKGRIVRDKWVAQAKLIVSEGLEAFRIRGKTNDY